MGVIGDLFGKGPASKAARASERSTQQLADMSKEMWASGSPYRNALGQQWSNTQPLYGSMLSYLMDPTGKTSFGSIPTMTPGGGAGTSAKQPTGLNSWLQQLFGNQDAISTAKADTWGTTAAPTGAGIAQWMPYLDADNPYTAEQKGSMLGGANTNIGLAAQNMAGENAAVMSRRGLGGIGTTSTSDRNAMIGLQNTKRNALAGANAAFTKEAIQRSDFLRTLNLQTFSNLLQWIQGNVSGTAGLGMQGVQNAMSGTGQAAQNQLGQAQMWGQQLADLLAGAGALAGGG